MKKSIIKGPLIVTMDKSKAPFFRGDIIISDDRIERIVEAPEEAEAGKEDLVINADNLMLMPGLVNAHGHAAMTLFRGYADDMPLQEWLEDKIWPIEEHLSGDDVYSGTMLAIAEMIKGGTTTFTDMYFYMEKVAEAVNESGIRAVLSRGLIGVGDNSEKGLEETESFINSWHGSAEGRINVMIGPHAPYTCPPSFLKKVMTLAEKTGLPVQTHLAETKREVDDCIKEYGKSPARHLYDLGLLDFPLIAAHCVHLDDQDIELLAEKEVAVAHNPGSNLKLGSGIAPVSRMLEGGLKVGIGTDGASSNNNLDMFEEMRLAALLAKGVNYDPTLVNAVSTLEMATAVGAEALFLEKTGRLIEGWKADLIGLNLERPHLVPLHDPLAHLVYAAAASDVELVMVDGKVLLQEGELKTLDEERIMAEASRAAFKLAKKAAKEEGSA